MDKHLILFEASRIKLKVTRLINAVEHNRDDEVKESTDNILGSAKNLHKAVFGERNDERSVCQNQKP
jgi:hypothetical protein